MFNLTCVLFNSWTHCQTLETFRRSAVFFSPLRPPQGACSLLLLRGGAPTCFTLDSMVIHHIVVSVYKLLNPTCFLLNLSYLFASLWPSSTSFQSGLIQTEYQRSAPLCFTLNNIRHQMWKLFSNTMFLPQKYRSANRTRIRSHYPPHGPSLRTEPFCSFLLKLQNHCEQRENTNMFPLCWSNQMWRCRLKVRQITLLLPRAATADSRSRLRWLRNNSYFPFASLRGNKASLCDANKNGIIKKVSAVMEGCKNWF